MGNTVFLTPLLNRIHELLPGASIDVAVAYPYAQELLATQPGLRRVIPFPHKGPRLVRRYFRALRELRAQSYDIAIDPTAESTGGRIVITLCRAKHRIGFVTYSQWAPLTHAIPQPHGFTHQGIQPVFLFSNVFGSRYEPESLRMSLCLKEAEVDAGRRAIVAAMERQAMVADTERAFGFFAHATAAKTIDHEWWKTFWDAFLKLEPAAVPVEFLPTPSTPPIDPRFPSLHFPSPRDLSAAIAGTRLFISADTGPMHLASATSTPTIGLFRVTEPALYRPLKADDLAIEIRDSTPQRVAERCQQLWRRSTH
ncbi:MAG TPA: glycosyltransferase family 9 protein [Steroidobacteraceae bacterium]|nr:glycosyltransferase family 9 protein [Steroidobacteraceae bacterium]